MAHTVDGFYLQCKAHTAFGADCRGGYYTTQQIFELLLGFIIFAQLYKVILKLDVLVIFIHGCILKIKTSKMFHGFDLALVKVQEVAFCT